MSVPAPWPDTLADELVTLHDLLRYAITAMGRAEVAHGHGFPDASAEAGYLLAWYFKLPYDAVGEHLGARATRQERAAFVRLLERRVSERVPAPYLTGEAWLGEYRFRVDPRVLIPRSFIASLLLEGLAPWVPEPEGIARALDLCTGSGCLAILLAHAFPDARVDGADLSGDALDVAATNVADHGLEDRLRLVQSDVFSGLGDARYDLIVSNPPYVNAPSMAALPPEYRHEPEVALAAGDDGLDIVHRILAGARKHLEAGGVLVVEIGHNRAALEEAYPALPFTWLSTHAGDDFVFLLTRDQLPG
jgi:ribosomal protein L3 glutamine methyltransferase